MASRTVSCSQSMRLVLLIALVCTANARQIRINRFAAEYSDGSGEREETTPVPTPTSATLTTTTPAVEAEPKADVGAGTRTGDEEEEEEVAIVREVAPSDFRPSRAFPLPEEGLNEFEAGFGETIPREVQPTEATETTATTTERIPGETTTTTEEVPVEAVTDKVGAAPYPAAGFRPSREFPLPGEGANELSADLADGATTTTTLRPDSAESTTAADRGETTTASSPPQTAAPQEEQMVTKKVREPPYPAAGFRPVRPFLLPTEKQSRNEKVLRGKAPYPAAGFRPARPFLLPTERQQKTVQRMRLPPAANGNSRHPACGVNDNPIAPTPPPGQPADPNAESLLLTKTPGHPIVVRPLLQLRSQPLVAQPLLVTPRLRPFFYTTHLQTW